MRDSSIEADSREVRDMRDMRDSSTDHAGNDPADPFAIYDQRKP